MKWLEDILNDNKLMRNIRFGFAITLSLALGLLYFGFYEQFELSAILNIGVGFLGLIGFTSWFISWLEISELAQSTECDENENIKGSIKNIDSVLKKLDYENEDKGLAFVEEYNKVHQEKADNRLTQKEIMKIQRRIRKRKYQSKPYEDLTKEVEFLRENPLFNKKFKPITFKQLTSLNQNVFGFKKDKEENIDLSYNSKYDGASIAVMLGLVKMVGLGLNAAVPFIIKDWRGLLVFYVMLIIWILTSSSKRYISVRYKTSTKYLERLRNQERLLKEVETRTVTHEVAVQDTLATETITNSLGEENALERKLEL